MCSNPLSKSFSHRITFAPVWVLLTPEQVRRNNCSFLKNKHHLLFLKKTKNRDRVMKGLFFQLMFVKWARWHLLINAKICGSWQTCHCHPRSVIPSLYCSTHTKPPPSPFFNWQDYQESTHLEQFVTRFLLKETTNQLHSLQSSLECAMETTAEQTRQEK